MISIIVPFLNEEDNLKELAELTSARMEEASMSFEIVLIDDGSNDGSAAVAEDLANNDSRVRFIQLRRNFGQTAALQAGLEYASGDILVPMDADLQNDPADIPVLVEKLNEGYDVVSGWRREREDGFLRKLLSRIANRLIARISGLELHDHGCSLKAYRRDAFDGLNLYGEVHRFIPLLMHWQGASVTEMPVKHHPRKRGDSKYGFNRTFKVILDLITQSFMSNFYTKPNYVFGSVGLLTGLLSMVALVIVCYRVFVMKVSDATPMVFGWAILVISSMFFFLMGLLAEMLSRIYFDSEGRKPYQVRNTVNLPDVVK